MARKTDDVCIFCEHSPCTCGKASRPPAKRAAVKKQEAPEEPAPSAVESMVRDSKRFMREPTPPPLPRAELDLDESIFVDAIKIAMRHLNARFVDPADDLAYRSALAEPDSLRLRLMTWRAKREVNRDGQDL